MDGGEFAHIYGWVLAVVSFNIQSESFSETTYANSGRYAICPLGQLRQHTVIGIVVHQYNGGFSTADQLRDKLVRIEYLPIEEDALFGRQRSLHY